MKAITKFFSAAVAIASLTSCSSDDLNFLASGEFDQTKLVGTLENGTTRTGMVDDKDANYPIVWSAGDKLNVYSLEQNLLYDEYTLKSGAGAPEAEFETTTTNVAINEDHPIAVTSSPLVYGLSAKGDKALLTTEIPTTFTWSEENAVVFQGKKYYKNDAPYWGDVTVKDGKMAVGFKKLTGAIKIDAALLPQGVKAVVIASKKADQPLSGLFNTILEGNNTLAKSVKLENSNQIRVNFPALPAQNASVRGDHQRVFILPLPCGTYENLKFLAIVRDKGETGFTSTGKDEDIIPNDGTDAAKKIDRGTPDKDYFLLSSKDDVVVTTETVLSIYPTVAQTLDQMTPMEISEQIAMAYDGKHDFIFNITNIKMDNSYVIEGSSTTLTNDNTIYILKNAANEGSYRKPSITLNFDNTFTTGTETKLYIKEANYNGKTLVKNVGSESLDTRGELIGTYGSGDTNKDKVAYWHATNAGTAQANAAITTATNVSGTYARKVNINLTKPTSNTCPVDIYMPTTRVTLGTLGVDKYDAEIDVVAEKSNEISNTGKTAGLNVEGNFTKVVALATHTGGTIVKGNVTVDELEIKNETAGLVKIDDASVKTINYSATQALNTYVYTVGSAAIQTLTDASDKVRVRAFWTGKALTDNQVNAKYDQATIYTAAQLASMGKDVSMIEEYTISGQVSQMHLGGSAYPWVGAVIDYSSGSSKFTLDGNGVGLRSMVLDNKTANTSELGLIRSIKTNNTDVTIKNIDLYQAVLTSAGNGKDNIGAVAGKIEAGSGAVNFEGTQNSIKEIDLTAAGKNVGGVFGYVKTTGNFTSAATSNTILTITKIAGKDNVAGLAGNIEAATVLVDKIINVTASGNITASGSQAGGLFGNVVAAADFKINAKAALDMKKITAGSINAGGIAGFYKAGATANVYVGAANHDNSVTVKATEISATLNNVGGLFGNADQGKLTVGRTEDAYGAAVTVNVTKIAGAYHVGGLVGLSNVAANVLGKITAAEKVYPVTVTVGSFQNTKEAAFFNTTELKLACGTFGGFIGKANSTVTIADPEYNIVTNASTLLSDTQKAALNFKVNIAEEKDAYGNTQYFWGDKNYNVGYVVEGYDYKVNGSKQTVNSDYNTFKAY